MSGTKLAIKKTISIAMVVFMIIAISAAIMGYVPQKQPTGPSEDNTMPTDPSTTTKPTQPNPIKPTEPIVIEPSKTDEPIINPTTPTGPTNPANTDIPEHLHNYSIIEMQPADCKKEGYTVHACIRCELKFTATLGIVPCNYILAEEKKATDTQDGYRVLSCVYCEDSYTVIIPAEGDS